MAQEEARRLRAAGGAGVDSEIPRHVEQPNRDWDLSDVPTPVQPRDGVVATPRATDQPGLGRHTGDSPLFASGETVKVGGQDAQVLGQEGDQVLVRASNAPAPEGRTHVVEGQELATKYDKVGEIGNKDYYTDGNGTYYELRRTSKGDGTFK